MVIIECDGFKYPKSVHRFVEKRISRWANHHFGPESAEELTSNVLFAKEAGGHQIRCELGIRHKNGGVWRAMRTADGPHQALAQCLEHFSSAPQRVSNLVLLNRLINIHQLKPRLA